MSAWNVAIGGQRVATVDLPEETVPAFWQRLHDVSGQRVEIRLAAGEAGTR